MLWCLDDVTSIDDVPVIVILCQVKGLEAKTGPSMVVSTGALAVACATRRNHASRCREAPIDGGYACCGCLFPCPLRTVSVQELTIMFVFQPREALLRHAETGDQEPLWTAGEYELIESGLLLIALDMLFVRVCDWRWWLTWNFNFQTQLGARTNQSPCLQRWTRRKRRKRSSRGCRTGYEGSRRAMKGGFASGEGKRVGGRIVFCAGARTLFCTGYKDLSPCSDLLSP